ncbi:MAG: hypothetical protein JW780_03865 [Clostridiales bacterium]|nr:hypothetical protein [Clostridiales bacterium]
MIEKYVDILKTVYNLAVLRNQEAQKHHQEDHPDNPMFLSIKDIKQHEDTSGLLPFLLKQEMETVKVIQTVMYMGREYSPETEEENIERTQNNADNPENQKDAPPLTAAAPEKVLKEWLSNSAGVSDWKNKELEVLQIYEKSPLDEYLKRAFLILGIS